MKLLFELQNEEDIHYLESVPEDKKDKIVRTALSIGLKDN
mgnify:CR=1 FL=1